MKIRILNGGHAAIAYPASLLDIHFVHDAMNHPLVSAFFAKIEREEIMPTVPPVPGVALEDYYKLIHRRFANPKIGDTIPRLAFDGSNRQPKFIVPVARDRLRQGRSVDALAFESALWCRHCFGKTETGKDITAGDPVWARLSDLAAKAKSDPLAWLTMDDVYGDVATAEPFRKAFAKSLADIWSRGTARALADFVGS
jgi:mannitol 2-dehydrogenase